MSFSQDPVQDISDIQSFLVTESQISRFNLLVHKLNDKCWDVCMNKVSTRLDPKTQGCLVNCVERFLDTSNFILNRLDESQSRLTQIDSTSSD